ncbi:thioredoxin-like protein [Sphaerotilus hippei]|uniref:Thioredoxin-like protein n=1 Tax=Sphaerotilus hippei TaxID=744406 RepID=A0A318GZF3_9BURK|nr:thioredoxin family protein [Sphaerotilus hippei]PXW95592.1 thioredoxin-like protein [Sphaerotilus hippei]
MNTAGGPARTGPRARRAGPAARRSVTPRPGTRLLVTRLLAALLLVAPLLCSRPARAEIPAAYAPMAVRPLPGDDGRIEFDLRPAQQRARQEGKSLYVYLGAADCPYCRRYEAFLREHAPVLAPRFAARYLVVDLHSQLSVTSRHLVLRTEALRLPYADFQRAIGDQRARLLVYPSVWLLDASGRPLMQMPAGAGTFQTVAEQIEILDLVE